MATKSVNKHNGNSTQSRRPQPMTPRAGFRVDRSRYENGGKVKK